MNDTMMFKAVKLKRKIVDKRNEYQQPKVIYSEIIAELQIPQNYQHTILDLASKYRNL